MIPAEHVESFQCELIAEQRRVSGGRVRCVCCKRPIGRGEEYTRLVWKVEGEICAEAAHDCAPYCAIESEAGDGRV